MNRLGAWIWSIAAVCCSTAALGQIGGTTSFQALQAVSPARTAALGGNALAVKDGDLNLGLFAPSLLDSTASEQIAMGFNRLFGEANISHVGYAHHVRGLGTISAGLVSLGYGTFEMTDETGTRLGDFNAGEYVFQAGISRQLDDFFSIGANVKYVVSQMAEYNASALAADISGTYYNPKNQITATLMMRNIGNVLTTYTPGTEENLPFEIQAGISKRLDKAPLRFSVIGENLQVWRLSEDRTGETFTDPLTGETIPVENEGFFETLGRHLVFNAEIILTENFFIRAGYNYNRRQELKIDTRPGTGGFTYGFGLRISKFHVSYARATFNLAGVANHFGLSVRFDDFRKS